MQPLPIALARISQGWSPRSEITDRAAVMRAHARAGNLLRAEEYATEVEALQRAELARDKACGAMFTERTMPAWAVAEWKLSPAIWGDALIQAYRLPRGVWAAAGWTAANVAAEANRVSPGLGCTAADVIAPTFANGVAA
jgi:hypothetical protein